MPRPGGEGGVHRRGYQALGTSASRRCDGLLLVILFVELIGPISPCIQVAILLNPLLTTILATSCRVTIPCPDIGKWTRMRLYYLDSLTHAVGVMTCTEFHGLRIQCKPDGFSGFNPPEGQTCGAWANEFVSAFGGPLDNANDTSACRPPTAIGRDFFIPAFAFLRSRIKTSPPFMFIMYQRMYMLNAVHVYADLNRTSSPNAASISKAVI